MRSLLTGVMLIALAAGAFAADPDDPVAVCYSKAGTQVAYGECLREELASVTKQYTAVVDKVMGVARSVDRAEKKKAAAKAFDVANKAFNAYLKAECDWTSASYGSGAGAGHAETACRINLQLPADGQAAGGVPSESVISFLEREYSDPGFGTAMAGFFFSPERVSRQTEERGLRWRCCRAWPWPETGKRS